MKPQKEKAKPEDFFIRDAQNEGVKVPLYRPDGSYSGHEFTLYGHFSDQFQRVRRQVLALARADTGPKTDEELEKAREDRRLMLTAALIKSWTFDMECTDANKIEFLRKAPQIAQYVDAVAGDQELFMMSSSQSSEDGLNGAPSSTSPSPEANTPSEPT